MWFPLSSVSGRSSFLESLDFLLDSSSSDSSSLWFLVSVLNRICQVRIG
jgi:hypothetical protein